MTRNYVLEDGTVDILMRTGIGVALVGLLILFIDVQANPSAPRAARQPQVVIDLPVVVQPVVIQNTYVQQTVVQPTVVKENTDHDGSMVIGIVIGIVAVVLLLIVAFVAVEAVVCIVGIVVIVGVLAVIIAVIVGVLGIICASMGMVCC